MISDQHKCIFIHIERTGGTSVERTIFNIGPNDKPPINTTIKHATALRSKQIFGEERWGDYFKFSIVRNPWDLVVSNYFFPWFHKPGEEVSFKEWLLRWNNEPAWEGTINPLNTPQLNAISIDDDIAMDYIIRYETLNLQWPYVAKKIGAKETLANNWNQRLARHSYLKERMSYPKYYDEESIEIVYEKFKKDIEHFGYKFGENIIKK